MITLVICVLTLPSLSLKASLKVVRRGLTRQLRVVSKFHPQVNFHNQEGMESIPGMYANCLE